MDELREVLLRAGISPSATSRYLDELRDHFDDLIAELMASGLSHTVARDIALRRLGDEHQLAAPMLADPRFRSIASRTPLLAWIGVPLLALVGLAVVCAIAVVVAVRSGVPSGYSGAVAAFLLLIVPIAIGWLISADAFRRRATPFWPSLGIASTIALGAAVKMEIDSSAIAVSVAVPAWPQLAVYALLTFVPLVLTQLRDI
jgi:hypothetical protein